MPLSGARAWSLSLADADAGVLARSHFVEFLHSIEIEQDFISTAELVFGELLGNVVRHAPGPVQISIDLNDDAMVLHVVDTGPPFSLNQSHLPTDVLSERGRGLFIVAQLAAEVRVKKKRSRGNHIMVTLARRVS
ncbi:MAG TPA: ATP-binding protein [Candidatus Babeliales bacterium]|nr:ATP-binding protein [Candidatus Babeliales bacterium]